MKKLILFAALVLIFISLIPARASADELEQSIAEMAGVNEISGDMLTSDELSGTRSINLFQKTIEIIKNAFSSNGRSLAARFGTLLASIVFCGLMSALNFGSDALDRASGYITLLILSAAAYSVIYDLYVFVNASMQSLMLALTSLQPVTASLYVMGGSAAEGAASSSAMLLFLTVLDVICTKVILPLLGLNFALSLAGAIPGSIDLSPVSSSVRSISVFLLSFVFAILGFTLYFQTTVAAASDTYVSRSVRFASGVFVPVIGSMLGDAFRTVSASVSIVRGTVGTAGIVLVLSAILPSVTVAALCRLMLSLCSTAARALGCESEAKFLSGICGSVGILFSLAAGSGVVAIIALAVFVK